MTLATIRTQNEALTALLQLVHASKTLAAADPFLLDAVGISTKEDGPMDAYRAVELVKFELSKLQCVLHNRRAAKLTV